MHHGEGDEDQHVAERVGVALGAFGEGRQPGENVQVFWVVVLRLPGAGVVFAEEVADFGAEEVLRAAEEPLAGPVGREEAGDDGVCPGGEAAEGYDCSEYCRMAVLLMSLDVHALKLNLQLSVYSTAMCSHSGFSQNDGPTITSALNREDTLLSTLYG